MRYTDWTSGEPIEKEWAMTGPTDPALRALEPKTEAGLRLLDRVAPFAKADADAVKRLSHKERRKGFARDILAIEAEALAAAEAAPLDVTDTECVDAYDQGRADALREAAPLDVDAVLREAEKRVRALPLQDAPGWYSHERAVRESDVLAILAALRSPDTETAGEAGDGL